MNILKNIYTVCSVSFQYFLAWVIPPSKFYATVQKLDFNRYKVVVHFNDRDVAIQFRRPRGPQSTRVDVRPELFPYLQNDRTTPIHLYKVSHQE